MELLFGLVVLAAAMGLAFKWALPKRLRAITWKDGERWVRFFPNPGFRVTERIQWSRFYGRGRI